MGHLGLAPQEAWRNYHHWPFNDVHNDAVRNSVNVCQSNRVAAYKSSELNRVIAGFSVRNLIVENHHRTDAGRDYRSCGLPVNIHAGWHCRFHSDDPG